jgi:hypothetical protein
MNVLEKLVATADATARADRLRSLRRPAVLIL